MYNAPNALVKSLLVIAASTGALTACGGGNSSSSNNQTANTSSNQVPANSATVSGSSVPPTLPGASIVAAVPVASAVSAYQTTVQELYVLYFGRPADPAGLTSTENSLLAAVAPTDLPSLAAAYSTNAAVKSLIDSFGTSAESQALYGGTGDANAFVVNLYQDVLGRAPALAELSNWSNAISTSAVTPGYAALSIMAGALTSTSPQGVLDGELVVNRSLTASYFTSQLASNPSISYTPSNTSALAAARNMLAGISWTTPAATCATAAQTAMAAIIPFTVSVTVSGLTGSSGPLVLQDNAGDQITVNSNGTFSFPTGFVNGAVYTVAVVSQPSGAAQVTPPGGTAQASGPTQSCVVNNSIGIMSGTTPANVSVSCGNVYVPLATGDSRTLTQPTYPAVCATLYAQFNDAVTQRIAASPALDDTNRINAALSSCAGTGQSVVLAASGSNDAFYTGDLNVNGEGLVVNAGVTLYGGNSYSLSGTALITVTGANSSIMGPGTIDGRGDILNPKSTGSSLPRLVQGTQITNMTVYNVTLANSIHPNLYVEGGNGLTVWGINIRTSVTQPNADGIDIDSMTNATVIYSSIQDGDDGVALKTNSNNISNITVSNNKLYGTHGLSVGSIDQNTVNNILFENNYVYAYGLDATTLSTDGNAINIKTGPCGLNVTNVTYLNTCIKNMDHPITLRTNYNSCSTGGTPQISNIVIDGVTSSTSQLIAYSEFLGVPTPSGVNPPNGSIGVYLANIIMDNSTQKLDGYVNPLEVYNSTITPSLAGTGVTAAPPLNGGTIGGSVPTCTFDANQTQPSQ